MKATSSKDLDGKEQKKVDSPAILPAAILLSGASGMLGTAVVHALEQHGAKLTQLVRHEAKPLSESGIREVRWNPSAGSLNPNSIAQLDGSDGITAAIHLSGANVASRRWTAKFKREMTESRVTSTRVLSETLARLKSPPTVLVAASAIGFYGDRGDEVLDERSPEGDGFFPELCAAWEQATRPAEEAGIRVVHLRFGPVLGKGGTLARLVPLFRLGLGGRLGSGGQWMSWVSEQDAVAAILFALEKPESGPALSGPINVVAPEVVTNAEFTCALGRALHRPTLFSAPAIALRLAFGDMADEALLSSARVVPRRLLNAGFVFQHPTLASALASALAPTPAT